MAFGVQDRMRMRYLVWEEGKGPIFVLEVASKSTWREDLGPKRDIYARLGVKEYWMYDPTGEYFRPVLQVLRLAGGAYRASWPWPRTGPGTSCARVDLLKVGEAVRVIERRGDSYRLRQARQSGSLGRTIPA